MKYMKYMRVINYFLAAVLITLLLSPAAQAANSQLEGAFADVVNGARPQGMGGAFIGVSDDANAPLWNPAGVGFLKKKQMTSMYADLYTLKLLNYGMLSVIFPEGGYVNGAVSVTMLSANLDPENWTESKFQYSVSKKLIQNLSAGINFKYLYVNTGLEDYIMSGWGFDAGLLMKEIPIPNINQNFSLGLLVENVYAQGQWNTPSLKKEIYPFEIKSGLSFIPKEIPEVMLAIDMYLTNRIKIKRLGLGLEYWTIRNSKLIPRTIRRLGFKNLALRAGFSSDIIRVTYKNTQRVLGATSNLTLGASLLVSVWQFDYAFVSGLKELGDTHRFSLTMDF